MPRPQRFPMTAVQKCGWTALARVVRLAPDLLSVELSLHDLVRQARGDPAEPRLRAATEADRVRPRRAPESSIMNSMRSAG